MQSKITNNAILFGLGLFLNNGYQVFSTGEFRIPGVLQYFADHVDQASAVPDTTVGAQPMQNRPYAMG